jgi:hypothetical protein
MEPKQPKTNPISPEQGGENRMAPIDPDYVPTKTATDLLAEGIPHKGGLAQLAAAEQMENPPPQLAGVRHAYLAIMARRKR